MFPDIQQITSSLKMGGVIIYPTDTIWGIGCDALNQSAIRRVYEIKEREADKPLIVLVSDIDMLKKYVSDIHPRVESLIYYHEKPLTIIYDQVNDLPDILRGKNGSVAIRIVQNEYCQTFIKELGRPIVSTSVNRSGEEAPVNFGDIAYDLLEKADYVSSYGRELNVEARASSIISFTAEGKINFLR